jgi:hypothetical protein
MSPNRTYNRPPYLLGLLGIIPLVGAFVGIGLIFFGLFEYKDKKLTLIGLAGVLFSVFVYGSLAFYSNSDDKKIMMAPFVKDELNSLVKNIEFYKLEHGTYPDSLLQLMNDNTTVFIADPTQDFPKGDSSYYRYKKTDAGYYLFSAGVDGVAGTKDDIFPKPLKMKKGTTGLLLPHK